mmetsp:Transcript_6110/g.27440  ORF Transcript_6110/g.27440 Transcript_6110/m.27440 type:complete len:213 (-) Transcript_6110:97-735(-)
MKLGAVPPVVPAAPGIEPGTAGLPESGFTPGTGYDPGAGLRRISTRVPTSVAPPLALAPASRSRAYSSISLASAGCPATLPSSSTAKADGDERWRSTRSSASAHDVRSRRWMPAAARAQSSGSAPRCTARTSSSTQYFSLRSNASLSTSAFSTSAPPRFSAWPGVSSTLRDCTAARSSGLRPGNASGSTRMGRPALSAARHSSSSTSLIPPS